MPNRNFKLLSAGQAISEFGSEITAIATPLVILQTTGSTFDAGIIASAVAVVELIGRLPGGLIADRAHRKRLMIGCDAARALTLTSVSLLLVLHHAAVPALATGAAVVAALSLLFNPAQAGLLGRIVSAEERRAAVGQSAVRTNLAIAVGPPIGGLLVGLAPALAYGVDASTFLISGLLIALITYPTYARDRGQRPPAGLSGTLMELTAGVRWVVGQRALLPLLALVAYLNMLGRAVELLSTFRLGGDGRSGLHAGLALTAAGLGGVVGGLLTGVFLRRLTSRQIMLTSATLWASLTVVLAWAPAPAIPLALFVMVLVLPPVSSLLTLAVLTDAPDELRGRISTGLSLLAAAITWLGPLATGWLSASAGVGVCGLALAAPLAAAALWSLLTARNRTTSDPRPVTVTQEPSAQLPPA